MKQASEDFIAKEQLEFLGMVLPKGEFDKPISNPFDMRVELLSPNNDLSYWEWIRSSFLMTFVTWWNNGLDFDKMFSIDEKENLLLNMIMKRPISVATEDVVFSFMCFAVPRTLTHQIVRHRNMVFGQQSLRVSEATDPIMLSWEYQKVFESNPALRAHVEHLILELRTLYNHVIDLGVPREQARAMMPMGITTKIGIKMNLRELIAYFKARTSDITQYDHTCLVAKMAQQLKEKQPNFYRVVNKFTQVEKIIDSYLIH